MGTDDSSQAQLDRLAEDFVARTRRGESPRISTYARAHPELSSEITDLFPLLLDLEGGKADDTPPARELGDYVLLREIGRGGMGVVYEAVQKTLGRRVALKILPQQMTLDPRFLERFQLEAKAAAQLQHPNIVPVFGSGEHDGIYYFTMQYVDGSGLDEVLSAGPMPGAGTHHQNVARLVLQASEGIAAAHARGVLHRDVKPSNLLLDDNGSLWISDFGLCKEAESDGLTQPGDLLGTFRYMAPERFEGVSDVQGDVYGLGITLYELLTREPAYRGDDREAIAAQVVRAAPARPRKLDASIPRDLELIVLKAIARDRSQRYATADALAEDLRAYLERRPISARAPTMTYLLRSAVRRHKAITVLSAAALLALIASTAYYVFSLREKESVARFRQYVANIAAAETALRDRDVPVARRLLDEAPIEFRNWEWHHLRSRLDRSLRSFRRWQYDVRHVAHGFDGTHVATCAAGKTRIHDEATTEVLAEVQHRTHVLALVWHPGGSAWTVGTSAGLEVWSWPGAERIVDEEVGPVRGVAYSSDGGRLAFGGQDGVLRLVDTGTRAELFAEALASEIHSVAFGPSNRLLAAGCRDATVSVFDVESRALLWRKHCGRRGIGSLAFVGGDLLAIPSSDGHVELRRVEDGQMRHVLGHQYAPEDVAASADGRRLLSCDGRRVHIWDADRGERLVTYGNDSRVICGSFHPNGTRIVTGSNRGTVLEWLVPENLDPDLCRARFQSGEALAVAPSGEFFVAGGLILRVFDASTREEIRNWIGHRAGAHSLRFSPDGTWAASGDYGGEVLIWHVPTDRLMHRLPVIVKDGHRAVQLTFSGDGKQLYTVGTDGDLTQWDVAQGKELRRIGLGIGWLMSITTSHDGRLLAIGDYYGGIRIHDSDDLSLLREFSGHTSLITELAFQRGDRLLASCSWDRTVRLWDVETGACVRTLRSFTTDSAGVADALLSVTFLPDGSRVAASSADCSAKLWDTRSGRLVATLRGESDWMYTAAFSPDGERLLTIEGRGVVRAWETKPLRERLASNPQEARIGAEARRLVAKVRASADSADAAIAAIRSHADVAADVREAALRMAYRARTAEPALIERFWRTFLPRDADETERAVALELVRSLIRADRHNRTQDPKRLALWALGAYRSGKFAQVASVKRLAVRSEAPDGGGYQAVALAARCMALARLDRRDEALAAMAQLEDLLETEPELLAARGVRAVQAEAKEVVR